MSKEKRDKTNECYSCQYKKELPLTHHIKCMNPDPNMTGRSYDLKKGWFLYSNRFDPIWKGKECGNYKEETNKGGNK